MSTPDPQAQRQLQRPRKRRLRDRLLDHDTANERLVDQHGLTNHLLLFDDDVRETAAALGDIEAYLARALSVLDRQDLSRKDLESLAKDIEVESKIAALDDTLASLRHRLHIIADNLE
jgi:hypothetical protein